MHFHVLQYMANHLYKYVCVYFVGDLHVKRSKFSVNLDLGILPRTSLEFEFTNTNRDVYNLNCKVYSLLSEIQVAHNPVFPHVQDMLQLSSF